MTTLDTLDLRLLDLLQSRPKAGMREYARVLGVARGTVQTRIARLERRGVIVSYAPTVDLRALGYGVTAYLRLQIAQGQLEAVTDGLARIPEVIEASTISGESDIICRLVAKDNEDLESVVQVVLGTVGVVRSRTEIVLTERLPHRVSMLIEHALREAR